MQVFLTMRVATSPAINLRTKPFQKWGNPHKTDQQRGGKTAVLHAVFFNSCTTRDHSEEVKIIQMNIDAPYRFSHHISGWDNASMHEIFVVLRDNAGCCSSIPNQPNGYVKGKGGTKGLAISS